MRRASGCSCCCFNPRPPSPRGDAIHEQQLRDGYRVSIHAPRHRGAMQANSGCPTAAHRFQSTPPVTEGRCASSASRLRPNSTFQSTPPVTEGRCGRISLRRTRPISFQSTPPVTEGRCRQVERRNVYFRWFQSTPPVTEGRCSLSDRVRKMWDTVSIHAPRHRGAMPKSDIEAECKQWFQSTPPVTEGRCLLPVRCSARPPRFNPRPPSPRGDASRIRRSRLMRMFQSTPPVTEGRCIRAQDGRPRIPRFNPRPPSPRGDARIGNGGRTGHASFNPRPPSPRGDAVAAFAFLVPLKVSIHAPRHRGAMLPRIPSCGGRMESFNPRPPSPRGDAVRRERGRHDVRVSIHAPRHRGAMLMCRRCRFDDSTFQSTPPVTEGRCLPAMRPIGYSSSFQSTPPVTEGRCIERYARRVPTLFVSIHAPRHRGAMRQRGNGDPAPHGFQSTPPVTEGRCSSGPAAATCAARFNPRPPSPRGDALQCATEQAGSDVSIHAPRHRGAMPPWIEGRVTVYAFQSTPPVTEGRCMLGTQALKGTAPVSIHAPRHRGAMRRRGGDPGHVQIVSIHAPRHRGAMRPSMRHGAGRQ